MPRPKQLNFTIRHKEVLDLVRSEFENGQIDAGGKRLISIEDSMSAEIRDTCSYVYVIPAYIYQTATKPGKRHFLEYIFNSFNESYWCHPADWAAESGDIDLLENFIFPRIKASKVKIDWTHLSAAAAMGGQRDLLENIYSSHMVPHTKRFWHAIAIAAAKGGQRNLLENYIFPNVIRKDETFWREVSYAALDEGHNELFEQCLYPLITASSIRITTLFSLLRVKYPQIRDLCLAHEHNAEIVAASEALWKRSVPAPVAAQVLTYAFDIEKRLTLQRAKRVDSILKKKPLDHKNFFAPDSDSAASAASPPPKRRCPG